MPDYVGIDLGTSAVKLLLIDEKGTIKNTVSRSYPLIMPKPGWSEQDPYVWWDATLDGLHDLLKNTNTSNVKGIGCGGQMHGLVVLDEEDRVIRPAILWNDSRTEEETQWLNTVIGKANLSVLTANIAFAGFTAPKLLWMQKHEPENFSRIRKIMLPKDYINYRLTGVHACDYSDASGMLLLDVKNKCWSPKMLEICGINVKQLPHLFESYEIIGKVLPTIAKELRLTGQVCVAAGAGDNAAAAVGTGTVGEGACNISLGTSGTIFISSNSFRVDTQNALHAFAHADGYYHLMGVVLSAASCNKWLCEQILNTSDYTAEQSQITEEKLGHNHVFYLPYLMGERSPLNDTFARGTFVGMSMDTSRADMVQAVLEGVAFALRDSLEVAKSLGIKISKSKVCGGGAKSKLWLKILANVLGIELEIPQTEEGPGYGGAMLAMVGCDAYESVEKCADVLVKTQSTIKPEAELSAKYEEQYRKFSLIYPALKTVFPQIL